MMLPKGWQNYINGREIVVWGTGKDTPEIVTEIYEAGETVSFFVSKDWKEKPNYIGKTVRDKMCLNELLYFVVIGTTRYQYEIKRELLAMNFKFSIDFVMIEGARNIKDADWESDGVFIGKGTFFPEMWNLFWEFIGYIGRYTSINANVQIAGNHPMDRVSTSYYPYQSITNGGKFRCLDEQYGPLYLSPGYNRIKIGNDVWIGSNVFINSSKVKEIGDGAIIGTGAVVIEDVPPYAIVVGVPGKIKKYRYTPEQIECLLRVKWWNWSDEEINENAEHLYNPAMFFERFM